jgi:hypothetical protein
MTTRQLDSPLSEEIEMSIFGPGYGEAIALHIGDGKWILVDSCVEPDSESPASLKYLHDLDVDVENAVRLIVATHWHDDHIRGIGAVFRECKSATISVSNALHSEQFTKFVALYDEPTTREKSGIYEFIQILQIVDARKSHHVRIASPRLALADRLIFKDTVRLNSETVEAKVFSLSPSDASVLKAYSAFSELQKKLVRRKRIVSILPNHTSVVLWIEVGHHKVLLGSDLETTTDPKTGWSVIVDESTVVSGRASAFKIPHHGSKNAHYGEVWFQLLSTEPCAVLAPFRRGGTTLPTSEDIIRICRLTSQAYATAPPRRRRHRWHERVVRDFVNETTRDIRDVHCGWGQIRLRKDIRQADQSWQVELFGDAYLLDPDRERRYMRDTNR